MLGIEGYSLNRGEAPSPASCTLPACLPYSAGASHPFTYLQKRSFPVPPLHPTAHAGIIPIEKLSA